MNSLKGGVKTAVIVQPCFFPWRGQFDLYRRGDVKIFLDTVKYSKGSWYNRNKIALAEGPGWITVPVQKSSGSRLIGDVELSDKYDWRQKIMGSLHTSYRSAPYYDLYLPLVRQFLYEPWTGLSQLAAASIRWGFERMNLMAEFVEASSLRVSSDDSIDRLVKLCQSAGANRYLSGPAAKEYIGDGRQFAEAGIELAWMDYPAYPSYREPEMGELSILDLLFMKGPDAKEYIWPGGNFLEGGLS